VDGWENLCQVCWFNQDQTKNPCEVVKVHNLPRICLQTPSKMLGTIAMLVYKFMVCFLSLTLGSSILDELESKVILRLQSLNA